MRIRNIPNLAVDHSLGAQHLTHMIVTDISVVIATGITEIMVAILPRPHCLLSYLPSDRDHCNRGGSIIQTTLSTFIFA